MTSQSLPDPTRLAAAAAGAAEIRALALDPDVIALRVEQIRAQVDACSWAAIGLGLAFTAVNVQSFAAAGAPMWSPGWLVAWLLDPMVSLLLIGVLRAEQVTARWQVATGWRVAAAKWGCFAATYAMNTWASWTAGTPSGVVLHSVPPLVVLLGAEVAPELRDRLTAAVHAAATSPATSPVATSPVPAVSSPAPAPLEDDHGRPRGTVLTADVPDQGRTEHYATPESAAPELAVSNDQSGDEQSDGDQSGAVRRGDGVGDEGADGDARVRMLAELLVAGAAVTGAQAAALSEVSERQGRRLLREAREQATRTPRAAVPAPAPAAELGVLRVVPNRPGRGDGPAVHDQTDQTHETTTVTTPGGRR